MKLGSPLNHESKAKTCRGGKGVATLDALLTIACSMPILCY